MGQVYRAVHETTGVEVAVKIIGAGRPEGTRARFYREVQEHASLVHPGIVYLLDYGKITAAEAGQWDASVERGNSYVAMELADAGTLRDHLPLSGWTSVRRVLLQVLDALAYAHARHVIHRDLKPENLLVFSDGDGGTRIKIADFGLSRAFGDEYDLAEEQLAEFAGTPDYMAPEQIRGLWRRYAPATDLYAVGCMAWELVCGRRPFDGATLLRIAQQHCNDERPPLEPQFAVPDGLEDWIFQLMAVDTGLRFRRAAEALWALPDGDVDDDTAAAVGRGDTQGTPTVLMPTLAASYAVETMLKMDAPTVERQANVSVDEPEEQEEARWDRLPPIDVELPDDWRRGDRERLPTPLVDTGLGLFDLREIPFVGRQQQRDKLWGELLSVEEQQEHRVVCIVGPPGVGKSRLAQWLSVRAHEIGAAAVLPVVNTPGEDGPNEGFRGLFQWVFQTWKMSRGEFYEFVATRLPDGDARAMTELVHPTGESFGGGDGPQYQFETARRKYGLLVRLFHSFMARRPCVSWFDDLQWGPDALGLLEYLLEPETAELPTLFVTTIRSDVLASEDSLKQRIETLCEHRRCVRIDLPPLDRDEQRSLVDRALPLEPEIARLVARRTEGNPLFARQLLSHWIDTDSVTGRAQGFGIADGMELTVADGVHELWMARLDGLLERFEPRSDQVLRAIELAAALGREVETRQWAAVCKSAGINLPSGLVSELVDRGLAGRTGEGWRFSHGLLVDSITRRAREAGRWSAHHRRCAEVFERGKIVERHRTARRRAHHWVQAGKPRRALQPLLDEAHRLADQGEPQRSHQVLKRRRQHLDKLGVGPMEPERLENELLVARALSVSGKPKEAMELLDDVLERSQRASDDDGVARAYRVLGECRMRIGELREARRDLERALAVARRGDDDYREGRVRLSLGWALFRAGELDDAETHFRAARGLLEDEADGAEKLLCASCIGWVELNRGDYDTASAIFGQIQDDAQDGGYRLMESYAVTALGDIARYRGELGEARRLGERVCRLESEMERPDGEITAMLNLAQVEMEDENMDRAEALLREVQDRAQKRPGEAYREWLDCAWMYWCCATEKWRRFDEIFGNYGDGWNDDAPVNADLAGLLEGAAQLAQQAGQLQRARRLLELTRELFDRLADPEALGRIEEKLREPEEGR